MLEINTICDFQTFLFRAGISSRGSTHYITRLSIARKRSFLSQRVFLTGDSKADALRTFRLVSSLDLGSFAFRQCLIQLVDLFGISYKLLNKAVDEFEQCLRKLRSVIRANLAHGVHRIISAQPQDIRDLLSVAINLLVFNQFPDPSANLTSLPSLYLTNPSLTSRSNAAAERGETDATPRASS